MGSKKIQPTKRGADIESRLNPQQRDFVFYFQQNPTNAKEAARRAGYKNPSQAAHGLLKNEAVRAFLGKIQFKQEENALYKADEFKLISQTAFMDVPVALLQWFRPTKSGAWEISEEELLEVPKRITSLIYSIKAAEKEMEDGSVLDVLHVRFYGMRSDEKAVLLNLNLQITGAIGKGRIEVEHSLADPRAKQVTDIADALFDIVEQNSNVITVKSFPVIEGPEE